MPYPLGGTARTGDVAVASPSQAIALVAAARSWAQQDGALLVSDRTVAISVAVPSLAVGLPLVRSWNGIGGVRLLPSFPQLERHATVFPSAL